MYIFLTSYLVLLLTAGSYSSAFFNLQGGASFARFASWNDCVNASFSLEFKTNQSEGLLWYVDDGGSTDFFQALVTSSGQVVLTLNIVDGVDGSVVISAGKNVSDGNWHKMEVRRKRMNTFLIVDQDMQSRISFGSDFNFGKGDNSGVYVGGLPTEFMLNLNKLSCPSALFKNRIRGSFRNIVYDNCVCLKKREKFAYGVGVTDWQADACDLNNPCLDGCLCLSRDSGLAPECDCSRLQCFLGMFAS